MPKLFNQKGGILKNFSLCFGFLFLAFFLFWPFSASAQFQSLINAFLYLPYALIALVFILFISITYAFAWLTGYILDVVMSPSFISLSYTNPATNQIIKAGLSITQSFVNLLLVLALVYTALSIALRINETGAKKMLTRLIIVALLVNFAPVFCGLVVDATNIVMYYFLKPMEEGVSGILTQIGPWVDVVISSLKKVTADLSERLGVLMMALTQIMVNVAMGIAFLLFASLFLIRYIAIWALVILAPLAFVGWVFPREKPAEAWEFLDWILFPLRMLRGLWDFWHEQFVAWSIIGIPLAFFLYLAMSSFTLLNAVFKQKITMPGIEPTASGFLNEVFPYFVVIVFLFLGFSLGLMTSARGSQAIIAGFRTAHKAAQKTTLQSLARKSRGALAAPLRKIGKEARILGRTYQEIRQEGKGIPKAIVGTPLRYARRIPTRAQMQYEKAKTAIKDEIDSILRAYQVRKTAGIPPEIAMTEAVSKYLRERIGSKVKSEEIQAMSQMLNDLMFGTKRGIVGTIRYIAEASLRAAGAKNNTSRI